MLPRTAFGVLLAVALIGGATAEPAASARKEVTGTKASLEPPPGFTVATTFSGFQKADVQASIQVKDIPDPFPEVSKGLSDEAQAAKSGMTILSREDLKVDGVTAVLVHVSQVAKGTTYQKWLMALGDKSSTTLVTGTFPASQSAVSHAIELAVRSTRRTKP
jgi:hypothetical protein